VWILITARRAAFYDGRVKIRSLLTYTILRLAFFLVPLGVMMLFPAFRNLWWLAVIFAGLIGIALSVIFLQKPRAQMSEDLYERKQQRTNKTDRELDEEIENEANEAAQGEHGV